MLDPKIQFLRPERSEGLPFFCVAWQRGNLRSGFHPKSIPEFCHRVMKLGRNDPWIYLQGPYCLVLKLAIRGPSLFSNLNLKLAVLGI